MAPEEILQNNPRFISRKQQESYFESGYLLVENALNIQNVVYIADPGSYFDRQSDYHNVAAGPTNNLLAYGRPMTLNIGVQLDF